MSVHVGSTILLECSVADPERTRIHWLKDKKPFAYVSHDARSLGQSEDEEEYDVTEYWNPEVRNTRKVAPGGALQIFNTRLGDAGFYACVATNAHGQARVEAYLGVTGA